LSSIVGIVGGAALDIVLRIVIGVEARREFEIVIQSGKKTLDSLDERTTASFSEPEENEDGIGDQKSSPNERQDIEFKHGLTIVKERKGMRRGACHVCCLAILEISLVDEKETKDRSSEEALYPRSAVDIGCGQSAKI
jgi:hypothetical protein